VIPQPAGPTDVARAPQETSRGAGQMRVASAPVSFGVDEIIVDDARSPDSSRTLAILCDQFDEPARLACSGRVHGLEGPIVADASIIPTPSSGSPTSSRS
jgi:hypothetical protein